MLEDAWSTVVGKRFLSRQTGGVTDIPFPGRDRRYQTAPRDEGGHI